MHSNQFTSLIHRPFPRTVILTLSLALGGCGSSSDAQETDGAGVEGGNNFVNTAGSTLTVASWGGQYEFSQQKAYQEPYTAKTGTPINSVEHDSTLEDLKRQVTEDDVIWDIVDVEPAQARDLCEGGFIEPIDKSVLLSASDGTAATDDFFPGSLQECAVPNIVWSSVVAYETSALSPAPTAMADFFDLTTYPGKRGLRRSPQAALEIALMADGVDPRDVYDVLTTETGVDQAFRKLDEIKADIVWWQAGAESIELLSSQSVIMGTTYNGRLFNEIANSINGLEYLWDGQVWSLDMWVIPKGTANKELALDFLAFATSTEALAAQASYIAYGPARQSSQALVGTHYELGIDMKPLMPTAAQNFQNAVMLDTDFWHLNGDRLETRFNAWIDAN